MQCTFFDEKNLCQDLRFIHLPKIKQINVAAICLHLFSRAIDFGILKQVFRSGCARNHYKIFKSGSRIGSFCKPKKLNLFNFPSTCSYLTNKQMLRKIYGDKVKTNLNPQLTHMVTHFSHQVGL
jgi:hypothetical protein